MNYAGYFLIVADFIKHAKSEGIPVGPGRGSGAGSLVAYALTITDLDPIRFGLLFERFLPIPNACRCRTSTSTSARTRGEVIDYRPAALWPRSGGADHHLRYPAGEGRAARRRRVLQMPYGQVEQADKAGAAKSGGASDAGGGDRERTELQAFRDEDAVVARAFDIAQRLEGLTRHASTHCAGIVIGDRP